MKQILQNLNSGKINIENIPCPQTNQINSCEILIQTSKTLISAGTERMLLEFGQASLLGKIKQQPDKVRQVLNKIKTDGLLTTLEAVKSKLDQPIPLGYCNVGKIIAIGPKVKNFNIGDRVISNGPHAEIVTVSENLCAKIPDQVTDDQAVFTIISAIGLQGIRLANPTMGEYFVIFGLGLIGLLTLQLLKAQGCQVMGIDFDQSRCDLAKSYGAQVINGSIGSESIIAQALAFSKNQGVDGVIITASTKSSELMHQAAQMSRKRGRVILIGVVGLELSRADFYEKELSFQVSCSYGPGRYENNYEQKNMDYPIGFVRWTEQRNFEAILNLFSEQKISTQDLITHQYLITQAEEAYSTLTTHKSALGIILNYPDQPLSQLTQDTQLIFNQPIYTDHKNNKNHKTISFLFIGAGNYASRVLIPAFKKAGAGLHTLISKKGISGFIQARKLKFIQTSTNYLPFLNHPEIQAVAIATQHHQHAEQTILALKNHKAVFVEKPLAINQTELDQIIQTYTDLSSKNSKPLLMVGFNRRFSPHIQKIKHSLLKNPGPLSMIYTINAGLINKDHWTQDLESGGGRLIGEACHFIDLLVYLSGAKIIKSNLISIPINNNPTQDIFSIQLVFSNGSIGSIHYFANGHQKFPKERLEIFTQGKIYQLDNFRKLIVYGDSQLKKFKTKSINKGQEECTQAFIDSIKNQSPAPISFEELVHVTQVCLDLAP